MFTAIHRALVLYTVSTQLPTSWPIRKNRRAHLMILLPWAGRTCGPLIFIWSPASSNILSGQQSAARQAVDCTTIGPKGIVRFWSRRKRLRLLVKYIDDRVFARPGPEIPFGLIVQYLQSKSKSRFTFLYERHPTFHLNPRIQMLTFRFFEVAVWQQGMQCQTLLTVTI